jgi:hypothetical protein
MSGEAGTFSGEAHGGLCRGAAHVFGREGGAGQQERGCLEGAGMGVSRKGHLADCKLCNCAAHDVKSHNVAAEPGGMHDNSVRQFCESGGRAERLEPKVQSLRA